MTATERKEKMLVGTHTPEELSQLLETGYFVKGKQRITNDTREGGPYPEIRFWDDWEQRRSHAWASNIATLLEVTRLDISSWSWHRNGS